MKPNKSVSYFPVDAAEQALLLRVREPDLAGRLPEVVEILDLIAESQLTAADLEQAIELLVQNRQGEGRDARFENLEGRLREHIEQGLTAIEGRLSRRLSGDPAPVRPPPPKPPRGAVQILPPPPPVPKDANLAVRIGSEVVSGPSAAQFYVAVWRWLFEKGHAKPTELPIQGGKLRYVVAKEAVHPSGKPFTRWEEAVPGVYVEVNLSRTDITAARRGTSATMASGLRCSSDRTRRPSGGSCCPRWTVFRVRSLLEPRGRSVRTAVRRAMGGDRPFGDAALQRLGNGRRPPAAPRRHGYCAAHLR